MVEIRVQGTQSERAIITFGSTTTVGSYYRVLLLHWWLPNELVVSGGGKWKRILVNASLVASNCIKALRAIWVDN